ncbi:MAG: integrase family protein [Thermoleophilia bacterium]|nr:integrase family protein [Thermoleophilia bacterium]
MRAPDDLSLTRAIDRYVSSLEGAGYSPNTLKAYATRLNDYAAWVAGPASEPSTDAPAPFVAPLQDAETIQAYLASLRRRRIGRRVGVSTQTLHHAFAVLSGFHRWMDRTLGLEPNPMRDVMKPRGESSIDEEFKALTGDQLDDLLHVARTTWPIEAGSPDLRTSNRKVEDALLVAFMGLAGLRVSELCGIDRGDIVDDVVHVLGKGRKRRSVPLAPDIMELLTEYEPPSGVRHLFGRPTDPGRRLAPYSVEQRIPRLAKCAGIHELRVTPHVLRHTFGSLMLAADPTALVPTRDLMGHESVETTNKYAHTREEARRMALTSMQELRAKRRP